MTKHTQIFDAAGNPITDTIMPDGGRVHVKMMMMDAAPAGLADAARRAFADSNPDTARHGPGGLALSDADRDAREKALDGRNARMTDAWRNPPADEVKKDAAAPTTDLDALHAARNRRLEDSWKGAAA
jgi:hypothetical protein